MSLLINGLFAQSLRYAQKNNPRNIKYMPVVIFFACLDLERKSSLINRLMDDRNSASPIWLIQPSFSKENLEREIKNREELKGFSAPVEIEHADLETIKNFRIVDRADGQTAELFRVIDGSQLNSSK